VTVTDSWRRAPCRRHRDGCHFGRQLPGQRRPLRAGHPELRARASSTASSWAA